MSVIHWLLNVSCFGVALIPGRPEALGLAHIDKLTPFITGPVTGVVMYLYPRKLMAAAGHLRRRMRESDSRLIRRLLKYVDARNSELPWPVKALIVGALSVVPAVGLWVAIGFAVMYWSTQLHRAALVIGVTSAGGLVAAQLLASQMIPSAGTLQPKLEIATYVILGLVLVRQAYLHRSGLRLRFGSWVSLARAA